MGVKILSFILFSFLSTAFCEEKHSIVSELLASKYTGFVKLLEQANLLDELDAEAAKHEGLTILPTTDNYLVNKVSPVLLSWLKKEQNKPTLRRVLLNHFVPGHAYPSKWTGKEKTLVGYSLDRRVVRGVDYLGGIAVKKVAALKASDGVAHSLDGLIVPEDVKTELATFLNVKSDDSLSRSFIGWEDLKVSMDAEAPMITSEVPTSPVSYPTVSPPSMTPSAMTPSAMTPSAMTPSAMSPSETPSMSPGSSISPSLTPSMAPEPSPSAVPASAPAPGPSSSSIDLLLDALNATGNFTFFLNLLKEYGLEATLELQLEKDTTVLAPNDYAFKNVSQSDLDALKASGSIDELILYHVLPSYVSLEEFKNGTGAISSDTTFKAVSSSGTYQYETLYRGNNLLVKVTDGIVVFGPSGASASLPDLLTTGKLSVSGLDGVMIPDGLLIKAAAPSSSGYVSVNKFVTVALLAITAFVGFF